MKKLIHPILYGIAGTVLVISLIYCSLTAFSIKANFWEVFAYSSITAALFTGLSIAVKNNKAFAVTTAVFAAITIIIMCIIRGNLWLSAVNFINIILNKLSYAYSWLKPIKADSAEVNLFLDCTAVLLSMIITVTLVRLRRALPAAIIGIIAVLPCYLAKDTPPGLFPLSVCAVIFLTLFVLRYMHRININFTPAVFIQCIAGFTAAALIINAVSGNPSEQLNQIASNLPGLGGAYRTQNTGIDFYDTVDLTELDDLNLNSLDEVNVLTDIPSGDVYLKDAAYSEFSDNMWIQKADNWEDRYSLTLRFGMDDKYLSSMPETPPARKLSVKELIPREHSLFPYIIDVKYGLEDNFDINKDIYLKATKNPVDSYGFTVKDFGLFPTDSFNEAYHDNGYAEYVYKNYTQVPKGVSDIVSENTYLASARDHEPLDGKIKAARQFFDTLNGKYSITDGKIPADEDYLSWFLKKKEGWCIHYATAAALILKELGIPARYASGYKFFVSEEHNSQETITVSQQSRHAWAEYYDPLIGWQPFDVTPGQGTSFPKSEVETESQTNEATAKPTTEEPTTVAAQTESSTTAESPTDNSEKEKSVLSSKSQGSGIPHHVAVALITAAAMALLIIAVILRRRITNKLRSGRIFGSDISTGAIEAYRYAQKLSKHLRSYIPKEVVSAAEKAKFSRSGADKEDLKLIVSYCKAAIRSIEANSKTLKKLYLKYVICLY